jgi:hypothetical protein
MKPFVTEQNKRRLEWLASFIAGIIIGFVAAKLIERYTQRPQSNA